MTEISRGFRAARDTPGSSDVAFENPARVQDEMPRVMGDPSCTPSVTMEPKIKASVLERDWM
jgi:hypothetical protein